MLGEIPYAPRNVLHAFPSYLWGFWYLDPSGIHHRSSIATADFDAGMVDRAAAQHFFKGATSHMLRRNLSRHPQSPHESLTPVEAVVFCQEIERWKTRVEWVSTEAMIRTAARTCESLRVKLHPGQSDAMAARIRAQVAGLDNVELSDASVHDLTEATRVVITQNSAAGFEALMQRRTVITCAPSDFHHATIQARTEVELEQAIKAAPERQAGFPFARYLYWFLAEHCLEPRKPEFADRAWQRLVALTSN